MATCPEPRRRAVKADAAPTTCLWSPHPRPPGRQVRRCLGPAGHPGGRALHVRGDCSDARRPLTAEDRCSAVRTGQGAASSLSLRDRVPAGLTVCPTLGQESCRLVSRSPGMCAGPHVTLVFEERVGATPAPTHTAILYTELPGLGVWASPTSGTCRRRRRTGRRNPGPPAAAGSCPDLRGAKGERKECGLVPTKTSPPRGAAQGHTGHLRSRRRTGGKGAALNRTHRHGHVSDNR